MEIEPGVMLKFKIRALEERDWAITWQIIEPVFRAGETYAFSPDITEEEAHKVLVELPSVTFCCSR